ncbi:lipoprotein [Actinoplanes siamensis]|uniref:Lipoprotein n=1 Tax=Actinoplanes siamensis TaxID=1223317 RepID=A0A919TL06_9ACTN|nr:lipoprotein [Actinoplanes siamensis]GIF06606.1 hypothetical protein Asi03nite_41440 [Actinoplanes siamensis]
MNILCRTASRTATLATLAALALTGCDSDGDDKTTRTEAQAPAAADGPRVGAAGSGCELPVTFGLTAGWKPKQVTVEDGDPLAALAKKGPFTMACEIDAKPAGNIGFLRVWTGAGADLEAGLSGFAGAGAQQAKFTETQVGGKPALEVEYQQKSELDDSLEQERAFAVDTGRGLVVVSLDGLDNEEQKEMLPAYELARTSLTVS